MEVRKWTIGKLTQKWRPEKPEEPRHSPLKNSPNGYELSECRVAVLDLVERSLARHDKYSTQTIILRGYWPPIYEMDSLETLPSELMEPCRTLSASKNMIEMISGLKIFKNLKVLSVAQNQIKSLSGLEQVSGTLEELIIAFNMIREVETLTGMDKLKVLDISYNHIGDLAEYGKLRFCPALRHLVFKENPICNKFQDDVWRDMAIRKLPKLLTLDAIPLRKNYIKKEK